MENLEGTKSGIDTSSLPDNVVASYEDVMSNHKEFLFPCVANYYDEPVVITKAKGSVVSDIKGNDYLDFFGGILTVSLGHCHQGVADAISRQVNTLGHTSTLYPTQNIVDVAKTLAEITPGKLKKSFFTNSGTEADETAIMLAKFHTGQSEIIVLRHCYAGRSQLATNITGHAPWRVLSSSIAGIKHAHAPYCYRCPMGKSYPSCDLQCASDLKELIQTETCGKIAAFMAEPILGVGGFITPPNEYFKVAVGIIRNYGGLFICDEVQTGFGRTGEKWFGIEHYGVEPEIMTMAKGIANGMPVGATIASEEVANSFSSLSLCTFGGNPVSMAATKATLETIKSEQVLKKSHRLGKLLFAGLEDLKKSFDFIGDVRGKGLMLAIELVESQKTKEPSPKKTMMLLESAKTQGLLLGKGGLYGNVIRIAPPMLISEGQIREGLKKLELALASIEH